MNPNVSVYVPFQKKDGDERIVEGYATSEQLDSQGEIIKIDAIKKALPDYMKYANIREMHQWSAVGKAISATIDDSKKTMYLVAKVIDDVAWAKVKEGVYNGFSIGGKILKRVGNEIEELTLSEISLVDRPANPAAIFSLVKSASGDFRKDAGSEPDSADKEEEMDHSSVYVAGHILDIAKEMVYLCEMFMMQEKDTSALEQIIATLKTVATSELADKADATKLSSILNDFEKRKQIIVQKKAGIKKQRAVPTADFLADFVPQSQWTEDYFSQLKKVLG